MKGCARGERARRENSLDGWCGGCDDRLEKPCGGRRLRAGRGRKQFDVFPFFTVSFALLFPVKQFLR